MSDSNPMNNGAPQGTHPLSFDEEILQRSLGDAGRWAYGVVWAECWLLSEDRRTLIQPHCGCWVDPVFHQNNCKGEHCPVCQVTNEDHKEYIPPDKVILGEGLPGILWAEDNSKRHQHFLSNRTLIGGTTAAEHSVTWRDLGSLANDPHKPYNPRLVQLTRAGLGLATGIPIYYEDERQGIVIFMCRGGVDAEQLTSQTNDEYLHAATNLIAATVALRKPRQKIVKERHDQHVKLMRRIKAKLLAMIFFGQAIHEVVDENHENALREEARKNGKHRSSSKPIQRMLRSDSSNFRVAFGTHFRDIAQEFARRFKTTLIKCKGANVPLPPTFGWIQSLHCIIGTFVVLITLTFFNTALLNSNAGDSVRLVLGPFGAFATLVFGLSAAPAAQPRSALGGQLLSVTIALAMRFFPIQEEVRVSMSVALAVGAMVKTGLTHPPAGASAAIFASSEAWEWSHMGILLAGNMFTVLLASFVNNWSDQKQYPTYWGIGGVRETATTAWKSVSEPETFKTALRRREKIAREDTMSFTEDKTEHPAGDIVVDV